MRTRIYNKMTSGEVEAYLARGGDTMFLGVGVVETHGAMPIDCETILPEAIAVKLADKADGLAMINLPYFYPGGTVISNATVSMGIVDGIDYLTKICGSLVQQGFKRLFLISGHGPAELTINAFTREFFEKTFVHPCHLNIARMLTTVYGAGEKRPGGKAMPAMNHLDSMFYGAYKFLNQMEYLPVESEETAAISDSRSEGEPCLGEMFRLLTGEFGGQVSLIYSDPVQHGGGRLFKTEEERLAACTEGEQMLDDMISKLHIAELKETVGQYQDYVKRVAENYPRLKKN